MDTSDRSSPASAAGLDGAPIGGDALDRRHDGAAGGNGDDGEDPVVEQAIFWYVRRASGDMSSTEEAALRDWLAADAAHRRVWAQLAQMGEQFRAGREQVTPDLAHGVLGRTKGRGRRRTLGHLLWVGLTGTALWLGRDTLHDTLEPADYRSATGERHEALLADGTLLRLNTATSVRVRYDDGARRILLRDGEIEVVTAADAAGRPLWVETRDARLTPVGTRFTVRQSDAQTWLAVREGAVDIRLANAGTTTNNNTQRVNAGQQARFDARRIDPPSALDATLLAWTDGMIVAGNRPLDDLLAELGRHRPGLLQWSTEVGRLRITGTWPLRGASPTDAVLDSLERRLPIQVRRLNRYWVRIGLGDAPA